MPFPSMVEKIARERIKRGCIRGAQLSAISCQPSAVSFQLEKQGLGTRNWGLVVTRLIFCSHQPLTPNPQPLIDHLLFLQARNLLRRETQYFTKHVLVILPQARSRCVAGLVDRAVLAGNTRHQMISCPWMIERDE